MTTQLRWNSWQDDFTSAKKWAFAIIAAGNTAESRDAITSATLALCTSLEPTNNLEKRDGEIDEKRYRLLVLDSRVRLDFMDIARAYSHDRISVDEGLSRVYQEAGKDEGLRGIEKYIRKTMSVD